MLACGRENAEQAPPPNASMKKTRRWVRRVLVCLSWNSVLALLLAGVDRLLQARLRLHADKPVDDFAVLENHERRDAADAVALSGMRSVVYIELADFDRALILACELFDHGCDLPARSTPGRPEVDKHRPAGLQNFGLKIVATKFGNAHS